MNKLNRRILIVATILVLSLGMMKLPSVKALDKYQNFSLYRTISITEAQIPLKISFWIRVDVCSIDSLGEVWIQAFRLDAGGSVFDFAVYLHQNVTGAYLNLDQGSGTNFADIPLTLSSWMNVTYYAYTVGAIQDLKIYLNGTQYISVFYTGLSFTFVQEELGIYATSLASPDDYLVYYDDFYESYLGFSVTEPFDGNIWDTSFQWKSQLLGVARSTDFAVSGTKSLKCPSFETELTTGLEYSDWSFMYPSVSGYAYVRTSNTTFAHLGSYGGYSTDESQTMRTKFAYDGYSELFLRFWFKIVTNGSDVPSGASTAQFCYWELDKGGVLALDQSIYIYRGSTGGVHFRAQDSTSGVYQNGTTSLASNTWYQIDLEIEYTSASKNVETRLYVSGNPDCSISESDPSWTGLTFDSYVLEGVQWTGGSSNCQTAIDDFRFSVIGFGAGTTYNVAVSSIPINASVTWEDGITYALPHNFSASGGSHTISATLEISLPDPSIRYLFQGWSIDGSPSMNTSNPLVFIPVADMTLQAIYTPVEIPDLTRVWTHFGIGLIGLIMMFLSWFVAYWLHKEGDTAKGVLIWLVMFIVGYGLFTVLLGG